jgi:hypothetical protein
LLVSYLCGTGFATQFPSVADPAPTDPREFKLQWTGLPLNIKPGQASRACQIACEVAGIAGRGGCCGRGGTAPASTRSVAHSSMITHELNHVMARSYNRILVGNQLPRVLRDILFWSCFPIRR